MALPRRRQAVVAVLFLLTGGLYALYWTHATAGAVRGGESANRALSYSRLAVTSMVAMMAIVLYGIGSSGPSGLAPGVPFLPRSMLFLVAAVYTFLALSQIEIAREVRRLDAEVRARPAAIVVLTFLGLLSIFYVQSLINRADPAARQARTV